MDLKEALIILRTRAESLRNLYMQYPRRVWEDGSIDATILPDVIVPEQIQYPRKAAECIIKHASKESHALGRYLIKYDGDYHVYLHEIHADPPHNIHDHPGNSVSWSLRGRYQEHRYEWETFGWLGTSMIEEGTVVVRPWRYAHRLGLPRIAQRTPLTLFVVDHIEPEWARYYEDAPDRIEDAVLWYPSIYTSLSMGA